MQQLRTPLFVAALVAIALAVLVEIGAAGFLQGAATPAARFDDLIASDSELRDALEDVDADELNALLAGDKPPGMAISYMALLDGIILFTIGLMAVGLVVRERVIGRVQGIATLIFSLLLVLAAIGMILLAIAAVLLMVGLFLAFPFGTIAYLAIYGFFNRGGASATLGILMTLKLVFGVTLILSQQRFLQNKGLVLITLTSLLGNVIISFLHGLVPIFLVSITDAIAAIVVAILAVIWAVVVLIGSIPAIINALRPSPMASPN